MDPISLAVLAALAGGAGGELGRQTWTGLTAIIRRIRGTQPSPTPTAEDETTPTPPTGEGTPAPTPTPAGGEGTDPATALAALEENPSDLTRAGDLERTLRAHQQSDPAFAQALALWTASFQAVLAADPDSAKALADAVTALAAQADTPDAGADHVDFRHGRFDGPVQGKGVQNITYNR